MAKQKNQYDPDPMVRKLVEISYDTSNVAEDKIRLLINTYNAIAQTARRWQRANQSAKLYPGQAQSDAQRSTIVDLTGPDADKLVEALGLELDGAVSKKDRELFKDSLTVKNRDQKYRTIRARLDDAFIKKLKSRFLESGTEFKQLGDDGLYEIAVPDGAMVSGAGKNHARRVTARGAMLRAINDEQERVRKEREEQRNTLSEYGYDLDTYERLDPAAQKKIQTKINEVRTNKLLAASPKLNKELIFSQMERGTALADIIHDIIQADPEAILPESYMRKMYTEDKVLRTLAQRAHAAEERLNNPDEIRRARVAQLKQRGFIREVDEAYYKDPANADDPYVRDRMKQERAARRMKAGRAFRRVGRAVSGAAHLAKRAVQMTLMNILATLLAGLLITSKTYRALLDVGETVRRRMNTDATLNFEPGTIRNWEVYAGKKGWDKDVLAEAAAGVYNAFGNAFNFEKTNSGDWVSLLGGAFGGLTSMIQPGGDANVKNLMGYIMDHVLANIDRGYGGVEKQQVSSGQAYSEQYARLNAVAPALAKMLGYLNEERMLAGAASFSEWMKTDGEGKERAMNRFENFYTAGEWDPLVKAPTQVDQPIKNIASQQAFDQFRNALGSFNVLREDLLQDIAINTLNIVNAVRSIIANFLAPFFPAFAAQEGARAREVNAQSRAVLNPILPVWRGAAEEAAKKAGYTGDFNVLLGAVRKYVDQGNVAPIVDLGLSDKVAINILEQEIINPLIAYALAQDADQRLSEEERRRVGAPRAIMVTPELLAEQAKGKVGTASTIALTRLNLTRRGDNRISIPEVDLVYNMQEALNRAERDRHQREQEDERARRKAEEDNARIRELDTALVNVHRVIIPRIERFGRGDFGSGAFGFTQGTGADQVVNDFNYATKVVGDVLKSGHLDAPATDVSGNHAIVSLIGSAIPGEIAGVRALLETKQWQSNDMLKGDYYEAAINTIKDHMDLLYKQGEATLAETLFLEAWVPLAEYLGAMPTDAMTTRIARSKWHVGIPRLLPQKFQSTLDNLINTYSGSMVLEAVREQQHHMSQEDAFLQSGVLDATLNYQQRDQAAVDNVINAHIGRFIGSMQEQGTQDIRGLLEKLLGAANDKNHIEAQAPGNGDLTLNLYLNGIKEQSITLKGKLPPGNPWRGVYDTWMNITRSIDPQKDGRQQQQNQDGVQ